MNRPSNSSRSVKRLAVAAVATAVSMFLGTDGAALRDVKKVSSIEFRGLKYLSRYEIINAASAKIEREGIVIDVDGLREYLKSSPYVKSFRVKEERGRIAVTVIENEPALVLALKKKGTVVSFELDERLRVLSSGGVRAFDRPVIIIAEDDTPGGEFSRRVKGLISLVRELKRRGLPVYREIDEIDLSAGPYAVVKLRGRKTRFVVEPDLEHLSALNYIAGYLDGRGRYPDEVVYCGNSAVMK
jgi:hypothetical protein